MFAFTRTALTRWIAPAGALVVGVGLAAVLLLIPAAMLEDLTWRSGIPALIPVLQPPLGSIARVVLALAGGSIVAAVTWSVLFLLFGPGGLFAIRPGTSRDNGQGDGTPTLRKADSHPDAPARRPMSASDLGAPMPPVQVPPPVQQIAIQPIPADLGEPLASFDPGAMLPVPKEPVRPVAPLATPLKSSTLTEGERFASVELPKTPPTTAEEPSIEALLQRLEAGARRQSSG